MQRGELVKTVLGMITKDFDSANPLEKFIENARKYSHKIDNVIILVCSSCDEKYINKLDTMAEVVLININDLSIQKERLHHLGIGEESINVLLGTAPLGRTNLIPYGYARNIVLMEAMSLGADELIFVDSDVIPEVLVCKNGELKLEEVDFVGSHLKYLREGSMITTSEYSGYNILPPAKFEGMEELLIGLGKENMTEFWKTSMQHRCITFQNYEKEICGVDKVLGGNCAFRTEVFKNITPFFSSYYMMGEEFCLARGEDTSLSESIKKNSIKCTDINTNIYHNTYEGFPNVPDLKNDLSVQERFFYACTGWIGRNPFYDYLRCIISNEAIRRTNLKIGAKALSEYTANPKFMLLNEAFEASGKKRRDYIEQYRALKNAWEDFVEGCENI